MALLDIGLVFNIFVRTDSFFSCYFTSLNVNYILKNRNVLDLKNKIKLLFNLLGLFYLYN